MSKKALVIIVVVVAIAAGIGAYLYFSGSKTGTSSSLATCKPPSVIYVYADEKQKEAGKTFVGVLDLIAKNSGVPLGNYTTCYIESSKLPVKLRFYPSILLKGNFSQKIMNYTVGSVEGARILSPVITMSIIRYLKISPIYSYHANLIIVEAKNPLGEIRANETQLRDSFSAIAMASIDGIKRVSYSEAPVKPSVAPYVILESSDPLSDNVHYLEKIGDKYYVIKKDYLVSVAENVLGARAVELYNASLFDAESLPSIGRDSSPVKLFIFEDAWCPYCALFYNNTFRVVEDYVSRGVLKVYAVDFLIHTEAAPIHSLLACLYNATKRGDLYFEAVREIYKEYAKNLTKPVMPEDAEKIIASVFGEKMVNEAKNCSKNITIRHYIELRGLYFKNYGIHGTPGFLIVPASGRPLVTASGYIAPEDFKKLLDWATRS